ncbi:SSI family serine proteinase inhibitor [Isoptericola sp. b441]|uniref:SSI family serine proteinase inhibitor n=1 Tax=Actinotalea lenta TaxID=3064654 RepID=A0ABT9D794_9CELL|nr:SSI family serine proteinase inhibitor [Isoptericola sp. b441]MDO8106420.1 SSI family serine proteinase inhibitor [Isoptericola sp. b441]
MRDPRVTMALLLPGLLLAGCATGSGSTDPGSGGGAPPGAPTTSVPPDTSTGLPGPSDGGAAGTRPSGVLSPTGLPARLTVTVDRTGDGDTRTWSLTCDPPGGAHPDPAWACVAIEQAGGASAFDPVPRDTACTQIYGGPQTAHVEGTVDGTPVDADFTRNNGCEINRWNALQPVLGDTAAM